MSQPLDLSPNQIVCCSLFAMSFANFVHLGYISSPAPRPSPWLFQLTETICTDTNSSKVQGKKLGTSTGSLHGPWFLTKIPRVQRAGNQGPCTFLLPTLYTTGTAGPQTIFEVPFWKGIESLANIENTGLNWFIKKARESMRRQQYVTH